MSIKLVDTLVSMGNFPVANADGIQFSDGESLQKKLDDGTLGGGAEAYMEMSQVEYDALTEEEKSNGTEYRTYDTGRIYKYGVLYGGKEPVETTWEDYKTLEADGLVDPTTDYIVTANENGILLGATDVAYDDTKTVKGKFDEVDTSIEELNNKVDTNTPKSNYIDNSDFSVNTRGQAEYVSDGSVMYTVDRWYIDGGKLSQVENGILLTNTNESDLIRLKQDIRIGFNYFAGKTLTLSAKIDGQILTKSATLPTEKPTGSSVQYIAVGIPAFGLNLNYVPTQDYFVPYIALAYQRNVVVEWVKLEINDALSTYIQPDYQSEKIKTSLMTNNGTLTLPASIDDSSTALLKTWSSSKITSYVAENAAPTYSGTVIPTKIASGATVTTDWDISSAGSNADYGRLLMLNSNAGTFLIHVKGNLGNTSTIQTPTVVSSIATTQSGTWSSSFELSISSSKLRIKNKSSAVASWRFI